MEKKYIEVNSIDEYISLQKPEVVEILNKVRNTIKDVAKDASEKISYGMPAFHLNGNLVYFAICKNHIGFYPTPSAIEVFKDELINYKCSKGAIQFPLDKPIPYDLIKKITEFRINENLNKPVKKSSRRGKE